jgi:hypothetical protein
MATTTPSLPTNNSKLERQAARSWRKKHREKSMSQSYGVTASAVAPLDHHLAQEKQWQSLVAKTPQAIVIRSLRRRLRRALLDEDARMAYACYTATRTDWCAWIDAELEWSNNKRNKNDRLSTGDNYPGTLEAASPTRQHNPCRRSPYYQYQYHNTTMQRMIVMTRRRSATTTTTQQWGCCSDS